MNEYSSKDYFRLSGIFYSFNNFQNIKQNDNTNTTNITTTSNTNKNITVKASPFNNKIMAMNERQVSWGSLTTSIEYHNNEISYPEEDISLKGTSKPNGYCFHDDKNQSTASNTEI